ncbi:unnamed protein product [Ambrosiozyma monospora]|uniref:Unnamed protein product n=1 Tax=Ambrosiozyma monospora TaxID=43982 RepID=A0ACB5SRF6_AMBMO|nr:unnamed protein product [Ambrosiozyma monospora]
MACEIRKYMSLSGHINNGFSDYCPLCDPHKEDPLSKGVKHAIFNCRITERLWSFTTNVPPIFKIPTNVLANTNLENSEIFKLNLYVGMVHQMYKRAFTHNDYGRNADIQPIEWHEHNIRSFYITYKNQHGYWDNSPLFN